MDTSNLHTLNIMDNIRTSKGVQYIQNGDKAQEEEPDDIECESTHRSQMTRKQYRELSLNDSRGPKSILSGDFLTP